MIDAKLLRTNPEIIKQAIIKRGVVIDIDALVELDARYAVALQRVETLRQEQKKASHGPVDAAQRTSLKKHKLTVKKEEETLKHLSNERDELLQSIPNLPADDVPAGGKENNVILKIVGPKTAFTPTSKDHVALATDLEIIDYKRGVKMSGNGFWVYRDKGAELEWALLNYFIDFHRKNKYIFIMPPYLLTEQSAFTSGHLPKFRHDLYWTEDGLCLNATSEMMLGNYHRDEVLPAESLPLKYYAYSTCFRREAGAYRSEERGMVRGHQFNKIEMFQLTNPQESGKAFDELLANAEKLVAGLGLNYRTSLLAAGDASAAMAKTVDVEVWLPSMQKYKEVSSVSNALDYQARRGNVRFKNPTTNKNEFVHTLNASGLATSRIIPAILEQFQQKDGSVVLPKALHRYLKYKKIVRK